MTTPALAVTGATGFLGGRVAADLAGRGIPQLLVVRSPERAPRLPGAEVRAASYGDRDAAVAALRGAETLFLVSAAESSDRLQQHRTVVDAAAEAGIAHVVYTSFAAAAPDAVFTLARDHFRTEQHIRESGMAWTFLRDSFYADFMELMVGDDGAIRGPAADGRVAIVARDDIVRTAVAVLLDPAAHAGRTYDLTGPEALTLTEVADTLSRARGRSIRFENETVPEAYASRAHYGAPDWEVDAWVSTYTAIASGDMAPVSGDVETVTGTPAQSFSSWLRTHDR